MILRSFRMRDLIYSSLLSSRERKRQKRNMLRESRKFVLKRLKIKREVSPRFKRRESKFSERCLRRGRMLTTEARREILLKIMPILDPLFMHLSLETDFLSTRKLTNTRYNLMLFPLTRGCANCQCLCLKKS